MSGQVKIGEVVITSMKKSLLLAVLPAFMVLSGCSLGPKTNKNNMIEDTLIHEEIFGGLSDVEFKPIKLEPNKALPSGTSLYKPMIGFQRKDNTENNTYSVRFVAAMQSQTDSASWYRSVHNLSGQIVEGKEKKEVPVTGVYSALNNNGNPSYATEVEAEDGTKPYDCYAVYCLLNIPNSFSDYYVDAFINVTNGNQTVTSSVGSINVADPDKTNTYDFGNNDRCLAFINGKAVESGDLDGNKVALYSAKFNAGDKLQVYYVNQEALTYSLYGNQSLGESTSDFSLSNGNELTALTGGIYNVYLNNDDQYYFQKGLYLEGKSDWGNNDAYMELNKNSSYTGAYKIDYLKTINGLPIYLTFYRTNDYDKVQFSKTNSSDWTGFMSLPTNRNNFFKYSSGRWSFFGDDESEISFTFDEDALNTPQRIHTEDQNNYLNFSGEYYNITSSDLSSFNANGNTNASAPLPVSISWDYIVPNGKTVSNYQLEYSQYEDLSDSYVVDGTTAKSISFYNPYIGDNYFRVIANFSDETQEASPIKVFKVEDIAPRNLKVGNMPNCRDMGGRITYAGGRIRQGMIYRTAGNKFDKYTAVNDDCKNILRNQLKVKTEINVADGTSNNVNLGGNVQLVNATMDYGQKVNNQGYPYSNLSRNAERIRYVMDTLADPNNYPVFYHCRIGTDRTGITGMMIGGLLGIPFNEVFQDYCFSNFAPIDGQRYPHKSSDPNGDDPAKYIDEIRAMPGATYQEQTYNALLSIGCSAQTLNSIIDIMTVGNKANLASTAKIGKGNSLTSTGTIKYDSNYNHPEIYYEVSSGKEASMTETFTNGQKDIVVYMGYTIDNGVSPSTTTLLKNCIKLKIDGVEQTITNSKNLYTAGFGKTNQNNRIAYMFNILGTYNLSAGQHTITISVTSGTFNIGTICVFDHNASNA